MREIMMTSGNIFEGYEILEYGEYKFTQSILSSNFLKDLGSNLADITSDRSIVYNDKFNQVLSEAISNFKEMVAETKFNAVIGFNINIMDFTNNASAILVSGTLVKLEKKFESEFQKSSFARNEVMVTNYYDMLVPRPVNVVLATEGMGTRISAWFNNYNNDDIKAIKADIEFINIYGDVTTLTGLDFVFDKGNVALLKSDYTDCKLPEKYIKMIETAKVYIKKYVTSRGVYECGDEPIDISLSPIKIKALKAKKGIDAVENYKSDGLVWTCHCGHVNEGGAEECVICGRKQDEMKHSVTFDYEPMIEEMKTKEYVMEIKDVLMKYIQSIDVSLRMQLLEIMESGIQYEKTRGDMKDTVIEKVENLFLGL